MSNMRNNQSKNATTERYAVHTAVLQFQVVWGMTSCQLVSSS